MFGLGDRVRLRHRPDRTGRIVEVIEGGHLYLVIVPDEGEVILREAELSPASRAFRWLDRDQFLRDLVIARLDHPLADSLYAYRASRTSFEPYQFRPALKFLRNPDQAILIADEVGLGKTIEAAIIYQELQARLQHEMSRVLVVCPSRLREKW